MSDRTNQAPFSFLDTGTAITSDDLAGVIEFNDHNNLRADLDNHHADGGTISDMPGPLQKRVAKSRFKAPKARTFKVPKEALPKSYKGVQQRRRAAYRFYCVAKYLNMSQSELATEIVRTATQVTVKDGLVVGLNSVLKAYRLMTNKNKNTLEMFETETDKAYRRILVSKIGMMAFMPIPEVLAVSDKFAYRVEVPVNIDEDSFWSDEEEKARKSFTRGRNAGKRRRN